MQAKETQPYLRAGGVKIEVAVDSSLRHDEILRASSASEEFPALGKSRTPSFLDCLDPQNRLSDRDPVQATGCQLLQENTVGDSVKGFAEV